MPDQFTNRAGVASTIPVEIVDSVIRDLEYKSVVLSLGHRGRNLREKEEKMPLLDTVIQAGFVSEDTGRIPLTKLEASAKSIVAAKVAAIAVVPKDLLEDSTRVDLWGEIQRQAPGAFGRVIDAAILFSTNAPASWPDGIVTEAAARSRVVDLSTVVGAGGDLYDALLGEDGVDDLIANDGHMNTGWAVKPSMHAKIRGVRGSDGHPVFANAREGGKVPATLDGTPVRKYLGAMGASALAVAGDWEFLRYAFRREMDFAVATEAQLVDEFGDEVINLFQQDSIALRMTMRLGWNWFSPWNDENPDPNTRFPWSVLVA